MSFLTHDDLIKRLMALGIADGDGNPVNKTYIDSTQPASAAVQATEQALNAVQLPAGVLGLNRGLRIRASLTTAANDNKKTIKVYLGSTAIASLVDSEANAKDVIVDIEVLRSGRNQQQAWAQVLVDGALVAGSSIQYEATEDEDDALAVTVKAANTDAAAEAATGKGLTVQVLG